MKHLCDPFLLLTGSSTVLSEDEQVRPQLRFVSSLLSGLPRPFERGLQRRIVDVIGRLLSHVALFFVVGGL